MTAASKPARQTKRLDHHAQTSAQSPTIFGFLGFGQFPRRPFVRILVDSLYESEGFVQALAELINGKTIQDGLFG